MVEIKKILVPVDFSQNSLVAIETACDLAARFDAEIVLLHVLELPVYPTVAAGSGISSLPTIQKELRDNVGARLEQLHREAIPDGTRSSTLLREGSPSAEIVRAVLDEGIDLIAIATHGHTGFKHFLLGSTTEKVVRRASCPVLTVRSPGHEAETP